MDGGGDGGHRGGLGEVLHWCAVKEGVKGRRKHYWQDCAALLRVEKDKRRTGQIKHTTLTSIITNRNVRNLKLMF